MSKSKEAATKAIIAAIKDLFPWDAQAAEESIVQGDPWGWGAEVATITTENCLGCLNNNEADWLSNTIRIQQHVKQKAGINIFIECYNPAIHNVYWDD